MRIAFLSIGRHLHTERWIRWFVEQGDECHLLTVQPGPLDGVTVHDIRRPGPTKPLRYWRSLGVVKDLLRRIDPDLLNTHFLTGYGYWGDFSGFRPNMLSVWGDDVYVTPHESWLKGWLAKRALGNADIVTGDSFDILKSCHALGASPDRCFEILWGVDFAQFHPDRPTSVRERLGIPADAPVIFSPRSFTQPYYNLDVIVAACVRLREQRPDVHVIFSGYEGDPQPFRDGAVAAGLTDNTHFVGRIPHAEFGEYLVASDVFVSVPSVDATAVSLLESMSCACAIVVSSLPSSMEWIRDGETGRVVPPRDADALTGALLDLVGDAEMRRRLGDNALQVARSRAGFDANMRWARALAQRLVEGSTLPAELRSLAQRTEETRAC